MIRGLSLFVLLISLTAHAGDTARCGSSLVMPGDTKSDVLRKCGEPEYVEIISSAFERRTEEWYYDFGPADFPRALTFEGYRLTRIDTVTRRIK